MQEADNVFEKAKILWKNLHSNSKNNNNKKSAQQQAVQLYERAKADENKKNYQYENLFF